MNKEAIAGTLALLRQATPELFRMSNYFHFIGDRGECGTAACIGGWAVTYWEINNAKLKPSIEITFQEWLSNVLTMVYQSSTHAKNWGVTEASATNILGLSLEQANELFTMRGITGGDICKAIDKVDPKIIPCQLNNPITMFDRLPAEIRHRVGIVVLEHLLVYDKVDWLLAITDATKQLKAEKLLSA